MTFKSRKSRPMSCHAKRMRSCGVIDNSPEACERSRLEVARICAEIRAQKAVEAAARMVRS